MTSTQLKVLDALRNSTVGLTNWALAGRLDRSQNTIRRVTKELELLGAIVCSKIQYGVEKVYTVVPVGPTEQDQQSISPAPAETVDA